MKKSAYHAKHASRKKSSVKLYIGIAVLVVVGVIGFFYKKSLVKTYPIDSAVFTTLERTIVPIPVPAGIKAILPIELSKYKSHGYGNWQFTKGLPYEKRVDLMPSNYDGTSATRTADLLRFFVMTDIHITDEETPAQAIALYNQGGKLSVYSGVMLYSTQVLDAAVQTINSLHTKNPFDFGISLGDAVNSAQYNEVRWYIDVLDGKTIRPDSGVSDDPISGPYND